MKAQPLQEKGYRVQIKVLLHEHPGEAIISTAKEMRPTFIAMATHGRSGLSELIHGSVAETVMRSGVAPVLLVRP